MPSFNEFAIYDCPPENRLNITICNLGEKVYFGFGSVRNANQNLATDVYFRIKDPNGNIVIPSTLIPTTGSGFIPSYTAAFAGPNVINASGYNPLSFIPAYTGDYFIEFTFNQPYGQERRVFDFFDITVTNNSNQAIDGRLWSNSWLLTVGNFSNTFDGKMFIYADDGIVTSVEFNDLQPYVFTISANETGCNNTGNFYLDRMSIDGLHTYPQYKIFLNNPDIFCYPSGIYGSITGQTYISGCPGNFCINITVDKPGNIEILLDLNGINGYQPNSTDVVLNCTVIVGSNCIFWDGLDGLGNVVSSNTQVLLAVNYFNGLTHLPMYDVETNVNGFKIKVERPYTVDSIPPTFWDDSNIAGGTVEFTGCINPTGCHNWICNGNCANDPISLGNYRTINTWWYANVIQDNFLHNFFYTTVDANINTPLGLSNDTAICVNAFGGIQLNGAVENAPNFIWTGGNGLFLPNNSILNPYYQFSNQEISNGFAIIKLTAYPNNGCPPITDSMVVQINNIVANAGNDRTICLGTSTELIASGGSSYIWSNGIITNSNVVSPFTTQLYSVTISNSSGCTASDEVLITINQLPSVNAGNDVSVCYGNETTLNASGGIYYNWSNGIQTQSITITVLNNQTFSVTITDVNGCTGFDEVSIFAYPLPAANAGNDVTICSGDHINITASGGIQYLWNNNINNQSINVQPQINSSFTVTVTDLNGCSASDEIQIYVNPSPTANAGNDQTICLGNNALLNASGGLTYQWNFGSNNAINTLTPNFSTTYTVTVSNNNGCTGSDEIIIFVNSLPLADAGINQSICIGESTEITASGGLSYSWNTTENINTITVQPSIETTYYVTVTDLNGCTSFDQVTIFVNPLPIANAGNDQTICKGDSTQLMASGGNNYIWSNEYESNLITIQPSISETYTVTVSNVFGCKNTDEVTIFVNALPIVNAGTDQTICMGNTIDITATGGISYIWNNSITTANIIVSPINSTTYTVTATDNNGCKNSDEVLVMVNANPTAYAGTDQSLCLGNFAQVIAFGGQNYQWSNGANTQLIFVSPNNNTVYTVTVTDINGCTASDEINIMVFPLPQAFAGNNQSICLGNSATLNGAGGINYNWSNGSTNQTIIVSPLSNSVYTVTVSSIHGCTAKGEAHVIVNPLPIAYAGLDQSICKGNSAIIAAQESFSYYWENGDTNRIRVITPQIGTLYKVTVSNFYGCTASDEVYINILELPIADAGNTQSICYGDPLILTASGGTNYIWSNGSNSQTINVLPLYDKKYTVTVTDQNGCSASDDLVVDIKPIPQADAGEDRSICKNDSITLIAHGGLQYEWNNGNHESNMVVSPNTTTYYHVTVTNSYGCTDVDTTTIFIRNIDHMDAGNDVTICKGNQVNLNAIGGIAYVWQYNSSLSSTIIANPIVNTDTSDTFFVLITDEFNCSKSDSLKVNIAENPIANAGPDLSICPGTSINLIATGGTSYKWNTNLFGASIMVAPTENIFYTVTVSNTYGCSSTDEIRISIFTIPNIHPVVQINEGCAPFNAILNVNGFDSTIISNFYWNVDDYNSTNSNLFQNLNINYTYMHSGVYNPQFTIITNNACKGNFQLDKPIIVYANPTADFSYKIYKNGDGSAKVNLFNESLNYDSIVWNFGASSILSNINQININNPDIKYLQAGSYSISLMVYNEFGCSDSITKEIKFNPPHTLFVPNAFTPDYDGLNDYFRAYGIGINENNFRMYIFDRWGEIIFESDNIEIAWDGNVKESTNKAITGSYAWLITYMDLDGRPYKEVGTVSVIR